MNGPVQTKLDQCLVFALGGQAYAVPILAVQEIRRFTPPTPLPDVPHYLAGVVNLRGSIVPVFDLRVRFGVVEPTFDRLTVIVVVNVGRRYVGLIVDDVMRVMTIQADSLRPRPELAEHIDISFVTGLVRDTDAMITMLDVDKLLSSDLGHLPCP